jgi:hypothetical protein
MIHPTNTRSRLDQSPRLLAAKLLPTTDQRLYQCPAGKRAEILFLQICNGATTATTVRFHHVAKDEASAQGNAQLYDTSIPANSAMQDNAPRPMLEGEELRASAGASSAVTVSVYGRELDL